jgi:hypothetical protein
MIRLHALALPALLLLSAATCPALAAPAPPRTAPQVLPGGGVADPAGKVGYVPSTEGGIEALDLATGKVLWSIAGVPQPLLATAERLYAQEPIKGKANQVRLAVFDTQNGKRLSESQPISFPDWVVVGVTYGRSFASTARLRGDELLLVWQARAWYAGGAAPRPEIEKAARKSAGGVARIDIESGKVEMLEGDRVPPGLPKEVPAGPGSVKLGDRVYRIVDQPAGKPGRPFERKRTLEAADADGKTVWQHEIKAPVFLPPLP